MKKSNNILHVLLVTVTFSAFLACGVMVAENIVGADVVFISAIILLPITFVWMLVVDRIQRRKTK